MTPIKIGGKIYGAKLTSDEKKAMQIEILKEIAELDRKNRNEIDAIFLWWLHEKLGFGYERLKQFYYEFNPAIEALCQRYEMTDTGDDVWLCTKKLKDYDERIDIAQWSKEAFGK